MVVAVGNTQQLTLIGRTMSPFVRRVAISLHVLGITFRQQALATKGEDRDQIRKFNPMVRVPVLVLPPMGECLYDSGAILDYVDDVLVKDEAKRLVPRTGEQRWRVLQTVATATTVMDKAVTAFYEVTRRPADKVYPDWLRQCEEQTYAGLEILETQIAKQGKHKMHNNMFFIHGTHLTQADISAVVALDFCRMIQDVALTSKVRLARFPALEELRTRAYRFVPAFHSHPVPEKIPPETQI